MEWRQESSGRRSYELIGEGERLATLHFLKSLGTLAECRMDEGTFTFKRTGFLHPRVTVRRSPYDQDIATMEMSIGGEGRLETIDGKRYTFQRLSFWRSRWGFFNEQGDPLMSLSIRSKMVGLEGEVEVNDRGRKDGKAVMLISLGWYLLVLMNQEVSIVARSGGASS